MPGFSQFSEKNLTECDEQIQSVFRKVILTIDCRVLEGHRGEDEQNRLYHAGKSKLPWPHSKHNRTPSLAADVAPYPIDWKDRERLTLFAGFVLGTAQQMGIELRWGGDWNRNWRVNDNRFDDLVHFELIE